MDESEATAVAYPGLRAVDPKACTKSRDGIYVEHRWAVVQVVKGKKFTIETFATEQEADLAARNVKHE